MPRSRNPRLLMPHFQGNMQLRNEQCTNSLQSEHHVTFEDWIAHFVVACSPAHFGQKTGFCAPNAGMNEIKSGIPCYGHDDALLFVSDWCVCIEVNYLQGGFTKIQTHAMTWRGVAFCGLVRLYRGKIFARWVYKNTNARNDMTMRCVLSDWCVCIGVKYLQDGFTKYKRTRWVGVTQCGGHKLRDFRTPYLRRPVEYMSLHRSGQMWRLSLNLLHSLENDLKKLATFGQNGVVT